jgi:hypothetical protein
MGCFRTFRALLWKNVVSDDASGCAATCEAGRLAIDGGRTMRPASLTTEQLAGFGHVWSNARAIVIIQGARLAAASVMRPRPDEARLISLRRSLLR